MKEKHRKKKISSVENFKNYSSEEKILRFSSGYVVPKNLTKEEAYTSVSRKIEAGGQPRPIRLSSGNRARYLYWGIAASALLIIGFYIILRVNDMKVIVTQKGDHVEYSLPDGSTVNLNADSRISFSRSDFEKSRSLKLQGEAFFNIKNGTNFVLLTQHGEITILGTTFNVKSRDHYFKVSCLSGKLKVSSGSDTELITGGESVHLSGGKLLKKTEENIQKTANWRNGEYYFEDMPLSLVLNEIERQFNITLEATGIENRFFTGSFYNRDLTEALDIVCIPMGLKYVFHKDKKIIISSQPK